VKTVVNHLHNIGDDRWLKQRVGVIIFEECWPLYADLEIPSSVEGVIALLSQIARSIKFKDAAGLGSLAYALSEGDNSVLSGFIEDRDIRIVANAINRSKEYWEWAHTQCSEDRQCVLVERAHKSFRKGGWPWDRAFMQAAAYLAVTCGLPPVRCAENFDTDVESFPFWVALDKHTPQGKKALREAVKITGVPWRQVNWASFYFESASANEVAPSRWWSREVEWRLGKTGLSYEEARSVWRKVRPVVIDLLRDESEQLREHLNVPTPQQMELF